MEKATVLMALCCVVYSTYHLSLHGSTPGGDSGELLAEACLGGTPHPPGYPLFTMMSSLAMGVSWPRVHLSASGYLPVLSFVSSKAWRVNHLCALLGTATAAIMASASHLLFDSMSGHSSRLSPACCVGALLFALSPLVWEYSLSAEVFALNNFFVAAEIWLTAMALTCHAAGEKQRWILWGAFCCGLAMANQHASLLSLAPLVASVVVSCSPTLAASKMLVSTLLISAALCLTGLSSYLYLYLASSLRATEGSWGDLRTLSGLLRHVLRSEYGTFQLGASRASTENAWQRLWLYVQHAQSESGQALLPLVVVGAAGCRWLRSRSAGAPSRSSSSALLLALLSSWLFYTLVWHCVLSNIPLSSPMPFGVHARFWMQPNIFLCVGAGAGARTIVWAAQCALDARQAAARRVAYAGPRADDAAPPNYWLRALEWAAVLALASALLRARFPVLDKSGEAIMYAYAMGALESLPRDSLLLAHTDLDWNPMRYLRACEGVRPDITHLTFQIMPYPWFKERQQPLYPNVTFPPLLPGVSTQRQSEGNGQLVHSVLLANGVLAHTTTRSPMPKKTAFPGGLYLDMQAINDAELGDGHVWHGLTLVPWGTLYRVLGPMSLEATAAHHPASLKQLALLEARMPPLSPQLVQRYPRGTWEHAALSVVNDARYQLAMSLLTCSMNLQTQALSPQRLPVLLLLVDRLRVSARLFSATLVAAAGWPPAPSPGAPGQTAADATDSAASYSALSSPLFDVRKNGALAWMRLEQVLALACNHRPTLSAAIDEARRTKPQAEPAVRRGMLLDPSVLSRVTPADLASVRREGASFIRAFLRAHPFDKDVAVFAAAADKMEE